MNRAILDLWVGAFVALGFVALMFLAMQVANVSEEGTRGETITLHARFEDIGGLKVKAPVKSAGVVVGRVTAIRFDPNTYQAEVEMKVSAVYPFPRDTIASILTSGLLGEQYIGLAAGADSEMLKDGDRIEMTQSALVLEKLIGQFLFNKAAEGGSK
ncbi:MAG: phospholipid/cholesterol/gamma-HCH transport system substrate-binding protein [Tepidiphilus sp.]|nr:phospholipid/cholesterol/gamma-HCH transport system substrate-binding protein [Tepidiphilus sp.]